MLEPMQRRFWEGFHRATCLLWETQPILTSPTDDDGRSRFSRPLLHRAVGEILHKRIDGARISQ